MSITTETLPGYAAGTWTLDPTHSEISFSVRHLAISKVKGTFETWTAQIVAGENPADTVVTASVDVASVNTNQKDRDNHLKTSDFFLVEEHPTITFTSTSIEKKGDDFAVTGDLTLRGVTQSVVFTAEFGGVTTDGYGQTKVGVSGTTKINRQDFGVNWNAALEAGGFTLGDDVTITVEAQFVLQAAAE